MWSLAARNQILDLPLILPGTLVVFIIFAVSQCLHLKNGHNYNAYLVRDVDGLNEEMGSLHKG